MEGVGVGGANAQRTKSYFDENVFLQFFKRNGRETGRAGSAFAHRVRSHTVLESDGGVQSSRRRFDSRLRRAQAERRQKAKHVTLGRVHYRIRVSGFWSVGAGIENYGRVWKIFGKQNKKLAQAPSLRKKVEIREIVLWSTILMMQEKSQTSTLKSSKNRVWHAFKLFRKHCISLHGVSTSLPIFSF